MIYGLKQRGMVAKRRMDCKAILEDAGLQTVYPGNDFEKWKH